MFKNECLSSSVPALGCPWLCKYIQLQLAASLSIPVISSPYISVWGISALTNNICSSQLCFLILANSATFPGLQGYCQEFEINPGLIGLLWVKRRLLIILRNYSTVNTFSSYIYRAVSHWLVRRELAVSDFSLSNFTWSASIPPPQGTLRW